MQGHRADAPSEDQPVVAPDRGLARKVGLAAVGGVLVFAALSAFGDVGQLRSRLASFGWVWLGVAILLASGNYAVRFLRWQLYLRQLDLRIAAKESVLVFVSGFIMTVTPGKLGEVFKSVLLRERIGAPIARTAPIVIAERATDLSALVLLTAAGCLGFPGGWSIAVTSAGLVTFGLVVCAWRPLGERVVRAVSRLPLLRRLAPRLSEAYDALHTLMQPGLLVRATSLALLAWFLEVLALYALLFGFHGVEPNLLASMFAYAASTIAGALAFMPGGLGVTEASMAGLLARFHDPALATSVAAGATILVRVATLWWAVFSGVVALAIYRRLPPSSVPT